MKTLIILAIALYLICFLLVASFLVSEVAPAVLDKQEKLYFGLALLFAPITVAIVVLYVIISLICEAISIFVTD